MKNASFEIEGMTCGGCVRHVEKALRKLDAVEVKQIVVGSAEVAFDPEKTNADAIAKALEAAGYPARLKPDGVASRMVCRVNPGEAKGCCCG